MSSSSTMPSIATKCQDSSSVNLPYLHDDLLLNCLARVSRLYYPILSLVSKRFRSLLLSKELYKVRTLLGCTKSCLYIGLRLPGEINPRWFTLCRKPTLMPNPNLNKSSDYVMVSVKTRNTSPTCWCGHLVSVGSNIYKLSGCMNGVPSSRVLFMDCRTHTWHEAPRMQMVSYYTFVSVLDGKIYVFFDHGSSNSVECFDTKTQTWEHISSPNATINRGSNIKSLAIKGKLYVFGKDKNVVYKPKDNRWDPVGLEVDFPRNFHLHCTSCVMIDKVLYGYGSLSKRLHWYDFEGRSWRFLEGLEGVLPELPNYSTRLANYGGNIAVLWEEDVCAIGSNVKMIWCAEISLERRNTEEIFGKVEWCDVVLTVPKTSNVKQFIDVTL